MSDDGMTVKPVATPAPVQVAAAVAHVPAKPKQPRKVLEHPARPNRNPDHGRILEWLSTPITHPQTHRNR